MSPSFSGKTWTHIGLILDSYWTHWLFGVTLSYPVIAIQVIELILN